MTVNVVSEGAVDLQFTFHIRSHMQNKSIGVEVYYIVRDLAVHAPCFRETKCCATHWRQASGGDSFCPLGIGH